MIVASVNGRIFKSVHIKTDLSISTKEAMGFKTMGRNLGPVLRRELANLDKDPDTRKSAMKALKCYVKDLDSKAIPLFLAQVSETKETGYLAGEFTISLYEVLARTHGAKIIPLIDNIMASIIQTLASSAGSFPLHQACSKVVPAIARYGMDPTTPEDKKRHVIHSLCKPLCDSLIGSQESLTSGAALCLKALVDADNWRFASDEMVNRVCQNAVGALEEKRTQTNAHIGLIMALAKRNALIVEAYARLLIQSGVRILNIGLQEGNFQKRLSAIQMVNFLMKCLDHRSIFSELELIIKEMEKCQSDKMAYVIGAAYEALQTAKRISVDKVARDQKSPSSVTGSNFSRKNHGEVGDFSSVGDQSLGSTSPESTLDLFSGYELTDSPIFMKNGSPNSNCGCGSVNRKLWSYENGGVIVPLKEGLFSEAANGTANSNSSRSHYGYDEFSNDGEDVADEFAGFSHGNQGHESRSTTSSTMRPRTQVHVDNIKIFKTPRKLIHSLQELNGVSSGWSEKHIRRSRSLSSSNIKWSSAPTFDHSNNSYHLNLDGKQNERLYAGGEPFQYGNESVSSTDDCPVEDEQQVPREEVGKVETRFEWFHFQKRHKKTALKLVCGLSFAMLAMSAPLIWINDHHEGYYLVPT